MSQNFNVTRRPKLTKPYVESYWESWDAWSDFPGDFAALLKDVPASPVGSCQGVNVVNIAFGDYSGGIAGHGSTEEIIREGITAIHAAGGYVKIALGGAIFSISHHINSIDEAGNFAQTLVWARDEYDLDGVDLDVEDGGASTEIQVALVKEIRNRLGDDFHISYTIPCLSEQFEPWYSTIRNIAHLVDAVNVMAYDYYWEGYSFDLDIQHLTAMGVSRDKIVLGLMPGHHDASNEYTSVEDAVTATEKALVEGLGGVMTWDINRDCSGRMGNADGEDNLYQTGHGDGLFLDTLSSTLNTCKRIP